MEDPTEYKLNLRLANIMNVALNLAIVDGGFIIGVQVIDFLMHYFTLYSNSAPQEGISKITFICMLISVLNLSAIMFKMTNLARGIKYSGVMCYQNALRRLPMLILLYMLGGAFLFFLSMLLSRITQNQDLLLFCLLSLIPYGLMTCLFIVDQGKNPLQAVIATFMLITTRIKISSLLNISLLYTLPFCISHSLFAAIQANTIVSLLSVIWILFCHLLTIIVYVSAVGLPTVKNEDSKGKVLVA